MEKEYSPISKKIEVTFLSAFYGPLLTAHQQKVLYLSNEEDLSLSEIASQLGVTRQGVHDILTRGIKQLYRFEEQLGMYKRFSDIQYRITKTVELLMKVEAENNSKTFLEESISILNEILAEDEEDEEEDNGL